jgi:ribosomal subunit interface protein
MEEFISKKVEKLEWYLGPSATIQVFMSLERELCTTTISIHHSHHDFAFSSTGETVFESISEAISKARRTLSENKRRFKDRKRERGVDFGGFAA